jgi:hypothetical protein
MAIRAYLADEYDFKTVVIAQDNDDHYYYERFVNKPYCRWSPYIFGMMCGIVYLNHREENKDDKLSNLLSHIFSHKYIAWGVFLVCTVISTTLLFSQMDAYAHFDNWNHDQNVTYITFSSFVHSLCLSGILMAILYGNIKFFLRWLLGNMWIPYANLTYSCYLAHFAI